MSKSSHRQPPGAKKVPVAQPEVQPESVDNRANRRSPAGARGRQRRELILDTAADLLVEGGEAAINTNALSDRAGISVGSVYQYFSNKEEILTALGARYMEQLGGNTLTALQQDVSGLDLPQMVDRVIDPMIAFERQHPAFRHFQEGQEGAGALAVGADRLDREILATIYDLLLRVCPNLPPTQGWQVARVTKALYKGMSYLVQQEREITKAGGNVDGLIADMKRMMARYLEEQLGRSTGDASFGSES
jgi:AcrR family transcriptional regulator